jgi:heme/copper-type cytochrome/quinol oxidase subunit 3
VQKNDPEIIDVPSLGMWLFLASEAMFFIAMLGAFVVLQSTGQQHALFVKSSAMLSKFIGSLSAIFLILSSVYLASTNSKLRWAALAGGLAFVCLQWVQWTLLLLNHTTVFRDSGRLMVSDGRPSHSHRIDLPPSFDVHAVTASDFVGKPAGGWPKHTDEILIDQDYGPSRNNFFASYFLMSAAHGLHVLAGVAALLWFMLFRRGKIPPALQNYWHFVNVVGIIGLAALYFV